jgi:hypothetical protein
MKTFRGFVIGLLIAVAGVAGAASIGGFLTIVGAQVDASGLNGGTPVVVQAGQTISAQAGGANAGRWTATGTTTAAGTLTFTDAAPNGRECDFNDLTTVADRVTQTAATDGKTVVTIAGTIVSGDVINYQCMAR